MWLITSADKFKGKFVVQKHEADKAGLHYDFRLEYPIYHKTDLLSYNKKRTEQSPEPKMGNKPETVLASWVIRHMEDLVSGKKSKVLAIEVEPHPVEYASFEGVIPEGYGKGKVEIYDQGTWELKDFTDTEIHFELKGNKLKGNFALIQTDKNKGLLVRAGD